MTVHVLGFCSTKLGLAQAGFAGMLQGEFLRVGAALLATERVRALILLDILGPAPLQEIVSAIIPRAACSILTCDIEDRSQPAYEVSSLAGLQQLGNLVVPCDANHSSIEDDTAIARS